MGILIEEIPHGWGYDPTGCWHGAAAEVAPIREEPETEDDDPLAPARGTMWGLLFCAPFWLLIGLATAPWWKTARL